MSVDLPVTRWIVRAHNFTIALLLRSQRHSLEPLFLSSYGYDNSNGLFYDNAFACLTFPCFLRSWQKMDERQGRVGGLQTGCVGSKSVVLLAPAQLTHLSSSGDTSELYLTSKHQRESPGLSGKPVRLSGNHQTAEARKTAHQWVYKQLGQCRSHTVCAKWALGGHSEGHTVRLVQSKGTGEQWLISVDSVIEGVGSTLFLLSDYDAGRWHLPPYHCK